VFYFISHAHISQQETSWFFNRTLTKIDKSQTWPNTHYRPTTKDRRKQASTSDKQMRESERAREGERERERERQQKKREDSSSKLLHNKLDKLATEKKSKGEKEKPRATEKKEKKRKPQTKPKKNNHNLSTNETKRKDLRQYDSKYANKFSPVVLNPRAVSIHLHLHLPTSRSIQVPSKERSKEILFHSYRHLGSFLICERTLVVRLTESSPPPPPPLG